MQSLYHILNASATTIHTLISLKSFWRVNLVKPQELCVSVTAVTLKGRMHYGKILIAYSDTECKPRNYQNVLACHHYKLHIGQSMA